MREVPDARIPQTLPELTALVCGYLNKRGLPPHQLSSLIEAIISSKDERDAIDGLLPADAQNFIDVVNEVRFHSLILVEIDIDVLRLLGIRQTRSCATDQEAMPQVIVQSVRSPRASSDNSEDRGFL